MIFLGAQIEDFFQNLTILLEVEAQLYRAQKRKNMVIRKSNQIIIFLSIIPTG